MEVVKAGKLDQIALLREAMLIGMKAGMAFTTSRFMGDEVFNREAQAKKAEELINEPKSVMVILSLLKFV